jgi:hypothetical protein
MGSTSALNFSLTGFFSSKCVAVLLVYCEGNRNAIEAQLLWYESIQFNYSCDTLRMVFSAKEGMVKIGFIEEQIPDYFYS